MYAKQGRGVSQINLAHQNRTIAIASDFRVDGAKSPEIPQKEGVLGSQIAARNRKSLATFHRTLKSQCNIALSSRGNRCDFSESVSTGVWCVPGFGAGFEIALEPSELQKEGEKPRKGHFYFLRQILVCTKPWFKRDLNPVLPFLVFFPCKEFLVFLSVFPFFSRDFRGLVAIKKSLFFWWFSLPFSRKTRKGRTGNFWGPRWTSQSQIAKIAAISVR